MYEKEFKREYKLALKKIKEFDNICVFRHQRPDGDAFGSQLGLVTWIKDNFPTKTVHFVGNNTSVYSEDLFPLMEEVDDEFFDKDFLAIIVDTGNSKRIDDERWTKAKYSIKFDHHPPVEQYGNLNIVANEIAACAELIADFCFYFNKKYPMSKLAATYLATGIITDSGRFQFESANKATFDTFGKLLEQGVLPFKDIYLKLYAKDVSSLVFQKHVLNNMVFTDGGLAYYILKQEDLDLLGIDHERGKEHLSLMSNIKGVDVWFCITEIKEKNEFRVSIRSKLIDISGVATSYRGGGHKQASGATLYDIDKELPLLIKDLEELIKNENI